MKFSQHIIAVKDEAYALQIGAKLLGFLVLFFVFCFFFLVSENITMKKKGC